MSFDFVHDNRALFSHCLAASSEASPSCAYALLVVNNGPLLPPSNYPSREHEQKELRSSLREPLSPSCHHLPDQTPQPTTQPVFFEGLWQNATLRVCADGGANRVYDRCYYYHRDKRVTQALTSSFIVSTARSSKELKAPAVLLPPRSSPSLDSLSLNLPTSSSTLSPSTTSSSPPSLLSPSIPLPLSLSPESQAVVPLCCMPSVILGDLDSVRPEVMSYYQDQGVPVLKDLDQDCTDLDKCLNYVRQFQIKSKDPVRSSSHLSSDSSHAPASSSAALAPSSPSPILSAVVIYSAFGGRFDQMIGAIQSLYLHTGGDLGRVVLLSEGNMAELLLPGRHVIYCHPQLEAIGSHCGLLPVGGAARSVSTTGLKWNLDGQAMRFGGLVSSSNIIEAEVVTVETTEPLLWTTECSTKKA